MPNTGDACLQATATCSVTDTAWGEAGPLPTCLALHMQAAVVRMRATIYMVTARETPVPPNPAKTINMKNSECRVSVPLRPVSHYVNENTCQ